MLIDYIDLRLNNLTPFLTFRQSLCFLDKCCFNTSAFENLKPDKDILFRPEEISLLLQYIDVCFFTRSVVNDYLKNFLKDVETSLPPFQYSKIKPLLTLLREQRILSDSPTLLSLEKRNEIEATHYTNFLNFSDFYEVNVAATSAKRLEAKRKIETQFQTYLELLTIDVVTPSEAHKKILRSWLSDNIALMHIGTHLQASLSLQLGMLSKNLPSELFHSKLIALSLDQFTSKTKFTINSHAFFSKYDSSWVTVECTENTGYCLGGTRDYKNIKLGPFSSLPNPVERGNGNHITEAGQTLPACVRYHPRQINICTDLLSHSDIRDLWLKGTDYENVHVLYSELVGSENLNSRFIAKNDTTKTFRKMAQNSNLIQSIRIVLIDENHRIIQFPRETILSLGLQISPTSSDI